MCLQVFPDAAALLDEIEPLFASDEAVNGLIYGVCLRMKAHPERIKSPPFLALVRDGARVVHAAMMTPPYNVAVWAPDLASADQAGLELIARKLVADGWRVPGVLGPAVVSDAFSQLWPRVANGASVKRGLRLRIYELRRVIAPPPSPGRLRIAEAGDEALVQDWYLKFAAEAGLHDTPEATAEVVRLRLQDGDIFLWEDSGQVVSLTGKGRSTPRGGAVGPVYTPPQFRGKGYASNCVAAVSQRILDMGKDFATLFTDLANSTSNGVYMKIGYVPRCDFNEWRFG